MKRVLTAVVLIPLVLLAVFKAPLWLFALVLAGVALLTIREYLNIIQACGIEPLRRITYAMVLLLMAGKSSWNLLDSAGSMIANLALNLLLIPPCAASATAGRRPNGRGVYGRRDSRSRRLERGRAE